jgi:hypothetical protein
MSYAYDRWQRAVSRWALEASQARDAGHGEAVDRIDAAHGNSYQGIEAATKELRGYLATMEVRHELFHDRLPNTDGFNRTW